MSSAVEDAYGGLGFASFADFLAKHTGKTLRELSEILGVNEQTLILYHSRWIDEQYAQGNVQPLRLD